MRTLGFFIFLFFIVSTSAHGETPKNSPSQLAKYPFSFELRDSVQWADYYFIINKYEKAIPIYERNLDDSNPNKVHALKKLALSEAALKNSSKSVANVVEYLQEDFNPNFLLNEGFDPIRESPEFQRISGNVIPRITVWSLFYLFVALIGFYVSSIIVLNNNIHRASRCLIAFFIFIHSLFILNISVNRANYGFEYPHTYLMSTWASFLYGPLLYYYFKATSQKYRLKYSDLLHFMPTLILTVYLFITVYNFSAQSKIDLMLQRIGDGANPQDSEDLSVLVVIKAISLAVYGYFIGKVYLKSKRERLLEGRNQIWQKNIYHIHILYVFTYLAYGTLIINSFSSGVLFDSSVIAMAVMVLYVGYSANIQPDVFNGAYSYTNRLFPKYEKSGLTPSLSMELKENLLYLFAVEKIYKENNISLDMVAQRLNTTRHNTSQIINEHFNVSFHEFVNNYRIKEAKQLLLDDKPQKLNIINIAYEVGYNNKVTFNKAFKKNTQLTPSEYQKNILGA